MSLNSLLPKLVPVFPLPEVVLFPRQILPLHIFEPRYRDMVHDAMEGDGHIAIALLEPGFEENYFTPHAPIHKVIGVGQIVTAERLEDGRYNLLLRGVSRARIQREFHDRSYRIAEISMLASVDLIDDDEAACIRERLRTLVRDCGFCSKGSEEALARLFSDEVPVGSLVDLLASGSPIECEIKQNLLEELNDKERAEQLLASLSVVHAIQRARRTSRGSGACHPN